MPNWCENNLILGHKDEDRIKLVEKTVRNILDTSSDDLKEEQGLMNSFVPRPSKEVLGDNGWYDWEIKNWGCKWDIYEQWNHDPKPYFDEEKKLHCIELGFDSAWSPPIAFYTTMEERGFYVHATFLEAGCDFIGRYTEGVDTTYSLDDVPKTDEELYEYVQNWRAED